MNNNNNNCGSEWQTKEINLSMRIYGHSKWLKTEKKMWKNKMLSICKCVTQQSSCTCMTKKGDFFLAKQRNKQIQAIQPSTHTKRPHYSIKLLYESMKWRTSKKKKHFFLYFQSIAYDRNVQLLFC